MDDTVLIAVAVLCPAVFVTSLVLTARLRRLAVLDHPNNRSSHDRPIPRIGGIAIAGPFLLALLALALSSEVELGAAGLGFAVASLAVGFAGLLDDLGWLSGAAAKFICQLSAALALVLFGVWFRRLHLPFFGSVDLGLVGPALTIFWLVAVTNAVNFMDGLNGLAAGSCAVAAAFFALASHAVGAAGWGLASALLVPAILGFLPFNFPRATLFMGDVGSQFLGFSLAALAVIVAEQPENAVPFFVMPLLLLHFLFDTSFTLIRRLAGGERVSKAHRSHLYQLLNRLGWSHTWVSALLTAMAVFQGIAALLLLRASPVYEWAAFLPFLALLAVYAFFVLRYAARAGLIQNSD